MVFAAMLSLASGCEESSEPEPDVPEPEQPAVTGPVLYDFEDGFWDVCIADDEGFAAFMTDNLGRFVTVVDLWENQYGKNWKKTAVCMICDSDLNPVAFGTPGERYADLYCLGRRGRDLIIWRDPVWHEDGYTSHRVIEDFFDDETEPTPARNSRADLLAQNLNKVRTSFVNMYNKLTHNQVEQESFNAKMEVKIHDYMVGEYSVPTSQTAAADWDRAAGLPDWYFDREVPECPEWLGGPQVKGHLDIKADPNRSSFSTSDYIDFMTYISAELESWGGVKDWGIYVDNYKSERVYLNYDPNFDKMHGVWDFTVRKEVEELDLFDCAGHKAASHIETGVWVDMLDRERWYSEPTRIQLYYDREPTILLLREYLPGSEGDPLKDNEFLARLGGCIFMEEGTVRHHCVRKSGENYNLWYTNTAFYWEDGTWYDFGDRATYELKLWLKDSPKGEEDPVVVKYDIYAEGKLVNGTPVRSNTLNMTATFSDYHWTYSISGGGI